MTTGDQDTSAGTRACANCGKTAGETLLLHTEYRCPDCGFEMAHVDVAPNGSIRGIFGYLKSVGEVIQDRYRVEKVLGKGGFGATYLVEDLRLKGKRRALKEVPELLFDEHEVNVLSQLRHPAIPDITDRFVTEGMIYLVLEFGGRRTLGSLCQALGGRVPLFTALPLMSQLCEALTHLHSQSPPIIHRDLKPENVLLDDNDFIMLIDFGIAKASAPSTTTRVMARAASHGFSPPEQVIGTGTDERSDIYSFGATFYYLLTGHIPPAAHERVAGREIQAPSGLVPGLPPELDEILLSTLSLNINQRPGSVQDLRFMLDALECIATPELPHTSRTMRVGPGTGRVGTGRPGTSLQGIRITTAEPIRPATDRAPSVRKRPIGLVMAVVAVVLLGLAAGVFFLIDGNETSPGPETSLQKQTATPREPVLPPGSGKTFTTPPPVQTQAGAVSAPSSAPQVPAPVATVPDQPESMASQLPLGGQPELSGAAGQQSSVQPPPLLPPQSLQGPATSDTPGSSAVDILEKRRGSEQSQTADSLVAPKSGADEGTERRARPSRRSRKTIAPPSRKF
jgi:serine/threonine-protein kinase